jgi:hypothetical protein
MNKKAFMKILEASLALLMTFLVITFIFPRMTATAKTKPITVLNVLEQDPGFRACVVAGNFTCTENYVSDYLGPKHDLAVDISENVNTIRTNLPEKDVYVDSIYISGNLTSYEPRMVKVYYWEKR